MWNMFDDILEITFSVGSLYFTVIVKLKKNKIKNDNNINTVLEKVYITCNNIWYFKKLIKSALIYQLQKSS